MHYVTFFGRSVVTAFDAIILVILLTSRDALAKIASKHFAAALMTRPGARRTKLFMAHERRVRKWLIFIKVDVYDINPSSISERSPYKAPNQTLSQHPTGRESGQHASCILMLKINEIERERNDKE